jgi:hypothetical protein
MFEILVISILVILVIGKITIVIFKDEKVKGVPVIIKNKTNGVVMFRVLMLYKVKYNGCKGETTEWLHHSQIR